MGFFLLSGGMAALPAQAQAPEAPAVPGYTVTLTAYNAVPEQTDSDPHVTASGAYSNPEIIAARSRDLAEELPFGTVIEISGASDSQQTCGYDQVKPLIGYRIIADTMNARYTDRIDILFGTESTYTFANGTVKNAGVVLGICNGATVRVVGRVDMKNLERLPKTQAELAAMLVTGANTLALK